MMNRTLFPDKPPHNRTDTSKLAADLMQPFVGKQRERVFEFIKSQAEHGATDEEIQDGLNMSGNSERPRRSRLVELGRVADSHNMRMTRSGRPATVWIVAPPDQPPAVASKPNWPTDRRSNPDKVDSAEFVPDFAI